MTVISLVSLSLLLLFLFSTTSTAASKDLIATEFTNNVINDSRVWLIEFYSSMCGSCTEFAPTWSKVDSFMKSVVTGKINIDEPEGMKLAESLGVLDEGLPNIRLFASSQNMKGISILTGDSTVKAKPIVTKIKSNLNGLTRRDDGFYLKGTA